MLDVITDIAMILILAGVCAIGAWLLKRKKQQILVSVTDLIQKAENAIQGSGMGAKKKAIVIAQLEANGIKVTIWLDKQIDRIVTYLNEKSAWLLDDAMDNAKDTVASVTSNE